MLLLKKLWLFIMTIVPKSLGYAWSSRRAWWFTATARTKARFARTGLGSLWLGLSSLLSITALSLVYGTVFKVQNYSQYVVYLGTGLVAWNVIASAVSAAPNLFEYNAGQLKNTNLNPIFYTLEEWAFQVQTFLQSFGLVLLALSFFQPLLLVNLLKTGLLPLVNLLLFVYWVPLLLCLVGARYRDLFQLVPIVVQLIFLLSPILYQKTSLGKLSWIADFNPFYSYISSLRHALLQGEISMYQSGWLLFVNILGIWVALTLLERERPLLPFLM